MIDLARDTAQLVVQNKIFADPVAAYRQVAIGALGTAALLVLFAMTPLPVWIGALIAGFVGGYIMPYLFKDVRFK